MLKAMAYAFLKWHLSLNKLAPKKKIQFRFYLEKHENLSNPAHKLHSREKHGTPMVPKMLFSKSSRSQLSNAVSTVLLAFLDQKLQPEEKKNTLEDVLLFGWNIPRNKIRSPSIIFWKPSCNGRSTLPPNVVSL